MDNMDGNQPTISVASAFQPQTLPQDEVLDFINSDKPLYVQVERSTHQPFPVPQVDKKKSYILPTTGTKGLVLILNIVEFEKEKLRCGSDIDVIYFSDLFTQLNFKLFPETKDERNLPNKTKEMMQTFINHFKEKCRREKPESIFVFIGSHGCYPNQICTSDSKYLDLYQDIVYQFSHKECPELKGKPKVFLTQACQVFPEPRIETDSAAKLLSPEIEDVLIYTAVMSGQLAYRDSYKGSFLPYCFTYVMMKYALKGTSLQDILGMVGDMLSKLKAQDCVEQVPVLIPLKFKRLYFSEVPEGQTDSSRPKKYSRLPTGLENSSSNLIVICTTDSKITCDKINDILNKCRFLEWEYFIILHSSDAWRDDDKGVIVVKDCTPKNLKMLSQAQVDTSRKIVFVIEKAEQDVKDFLEEHVSWKSKVEISTDRLKWEDLSLAHQSEVLKKLEEALKMEVDYKELNEELLINAINGREPNLFKQTLPEQLSYYVDRTVLTRNIISNKIFEQDSPDIWLISGIQRHELSSLAKSKMTGTSSEYIRRHNLESKFLMLEKTSHFEKIVEKSSAPVHLLQYENKRLRWIMSNGELEVLWMFVDPVQDELTEEEFYERVCSESSSNKPVCIVDGPGMGKTVLLEQMGRMLCESFPERIVSFVAFRDFIEHFKPSRSGSADGLEAAAATLKAVLCKNPISRSVLEARLKQEEEVSVELLLDGFDELNSTDTELALEILATMRTSFKSVRTWITTRPFFLNQLETHLNVLGYTIQPFREEHQVQFLTSFWSRNIQLDRERLKQFAQQCLQSLKAKLNSEEKDIAGIPLQCLLIGEVYEEDAIEYVQEDHDNSFFDQLEISSVTELYAKFIGNRFGKYGTLQEGQLTEDTLKVMHSRLAMEEIFPKAMDKLEGLFPVPVDLTEVLKAGIVTCSSVSGTPRFIHRTFADYFIAQFLTSKLSEDSSWPEELTSFFYENVLSSQTRISWDAKTQQFHPKTIKPLKNISVYFLNPALCYFLNAMIGDGDILSNIPINVSTSLLKSAERLKGNKVPLIAYTAIHSDNVNIFKLFDLTKTFDLSPREIFNENFLLNAIEKSGLDLVRILISRMEALSGFNIKEDALQWALHRGDYSIVEYLTKEKGLQIVVKSDERLLFLVIMLIGNSKSNSDRIIVQKVQLLRRLAEMNPNLVNLKVGQGPWIGETLLLFGLRDELGVHVELILELIKLGADVVLLGNKHKETIIHLNDDKTYLTSADYNKIIMSIPRKGLKKLVRMKNKKGETPLTTLLEYIDDPLPETLDRFKQVGAEFGDSLPRVIKSSASVEKIRKLVECGAKTTFKNEEGQSPLHLAASYGNLEAVQYLVNECKVDVNIKNGEGLTPLESAIQSDWKNGRRLETALALHGLGGTYNEIANSAEGQSWLHLAAKEGNLDSIRILLKDAVGGQGQINLKDKQGNRPLHLALREYKPDNKKEYFFVVQTLIDNEARLDKRNKLKETPLQTALNNDKLDLKTFQLLWSNTDIATVKAGWATRALQFLVMEVGSSISGEDSAIRFLVEEKGADVKWKNRSNETVLHKAAMATNKENSLEVVKYLVSKGADVNVKDSKQQTFLHNYVSTYPQPSPTDFHDMVEFLVGESEPSKKLITEADDFERTPLHLAMCYLEPKMETLELLHSNGANFNADDKKGDSILAYAVMKEMSSDILEYLIQQGADWKFLNGATQCNMLHISAECANLESLKFFLGKGELDINGVTRDGHTPLDLATGRCFDMVNFLAENGGRGRSGSAKPTKEHDHLPLHSGTRGRTFFGKGTTPWSNDPSSEWVAWKDGSKSTPHCMYIEMVISMKGLLGEL